MVGEFIGIKTQGDSPKDKASIIRYICFKEFNWSYKDLCETPIEIILEQMELYKKYNKKRK